jgi:eukaryotic-like serine/threonine-protein kinase
VAVAGDRPDAAVTAPDVPEAPEDATAMKPVTVISASGPRRIAAQDVPPVVDPGAEEPAARSGLVWAGVGVAVLALLVGVLLARGDGRPQDEGVGDPTTTRTPDPVVPDVLTEAVALTGSRTSEGVLFEWRPPVPVEPGDSFTWHRDDTDQYGTTRRRRLLVRTDEAVCLDVRMSRAGDSSPRVSECVS